MHLTLPDRRWWLIGLFFLATAINSIDRQIFAVLAPVFSLDLNISEIQYGFIVQAFLVGYTVMFVVSGYLIDRYGMRLGMTVCMAWWSTAAALHAFARGALSMGVFRFLLGVGESGNYTAAAKAVSEWFPPQERSLATGIYSAGSLIGAIICPALSVWMAAVFGWRKAFFLTATVGILWLVPWYFVSRQHADASSHEPACTPPPHHPLRLRILAKTRNAHALFWARVISEPAWWFYTFWLPKYLKDVQHFTMAQLGYTLWIPFAAADAGSLLGGYLSGICVKRGYSPVRARHYIMIPAALTMPITLLLVLRTSPVMVLTGASLALFAHMSWKVNLVTLTNDLFPATQVASVSGVLAMGAGLGGIIFSGIAGFVVELHSYAALFGVVAVLHPCALVVVSWLLGRNSETPDAELAG
jgi:ACS family hexuronate transporter-like MFS transporter